MKKLVLIAVIFSCSIAFANDVPKTGPMPQETVDLCCKVGADLTHPTCVAALAEPRHQAICKAKTAHDMRQRRQAKIFDAGKMRREVGREMRKAVRAFNQEDYIDNCCPVDEEAKDECAYTLVVRPAFKDLCK